MAAYLIDGHTIQEEFQDLACRANKPFTQGLHPGVPHVLGLRIPDLRSLAKRIASKDWETYLSEAGEYYMEERLLQGLVLGYVHPDDIEIYLQRVTRFVHLINSWSVCDTFSFAGGYPFVIKHQERIWSFIEDRMKSEQEYEIRFGVVMAIKYFINQQYIDELFKRLDCISHDGYYVKMAIAWAISVCYVKFPTRTLEYLSHTKLDDFTYNKSLQKILESYRVSDFEKKVIKSMKRK